MEASFQNKLIEMLKTDSRFVDQDGELVKAAVIDRAWKIDRDLVKLLLSNTDIKQKFFEEIEGHWVFNVNTFIDYISDKDFLDNSYTRFRNKIGLNIDGKYLKERVEVCLVWPYKDCVLEGGQTKEDEKRKEIFFNEVLAQDEIDRLLDPKVLTNWKRYTLTGEQAVTEIKRDEQGQITENFVIKGNNLIALHSLKSQFRGRVKVIYLDPPYNRDEESFYNDSFKHSSWLTFMKNRLETTQQLLKQDGCIFISIDDSEQAYLKVMCDEIFGRDNFLGNISYERSGVSGLGQGGTFLVNTHESILCYAKSKVHFIPEDLSGEGEFSSADMKRYNKYLLSVGDGVEHAKFVAPSTKEEVIIYHHPVYEIGTISLKNLKERYDEVYNEYLSNFENIFRNTSIQEENEFQNRILGYCQDGFYSAKYLVSRGKNKGQLITAYYLNGEVFVWLRGSAKVLEGKIVKTNKLSDFWDHRSIPKADLANEGGVKLRRGKKPENLMKRLITMVTKSGDLVLDFFSGSGTTCAVTHKMGRQYIGIEQLDYGENDTIVRLNNVINGDKSGISKSIGWGGGGDFIYAELRQYNEGFMDIVQAATNTDELVELWKDISNNSFLNWYINPSIPEDALSDFIEIGKSDNGVEKQKRLLCELLNKNQLYVNLSEIEDAKFSISDSDKELNKQFYGDAYNA